MPGLRDLAKKLHRTVSIADETITVRGLTANEMAELLATFPEMGKLMYGAFDRVDGEALQGQVPECVALMIALGTATNGKAPDDADLEVARTLPGAAALDLLAAIAELSLPRSIVRPFVAMVMDGDATAAASVDTGNSLDTR